MTTLQQAMNQTAVTDNGMPTNFSSLDKVVDLFFLIGSSRGKDLTPQFHAAFGENPDLAVRVLLWARDVRGGAGERQMFIDLMHELVQHDVDLARRVMNKIPELGRWSDVLSLFDTPLEQDALILIRNALRSGDGLCAKWMPRPTGVNKTAANKIRKALEISPKEYRKLLVSLSNTVEQQMCANQWSQIDYGKLPSVAAARYQNAFEKHAPAEYNAYIEALNTGEAKINAGALYPYDVVKSLNHGNSAVANKQWDALPNYLEGSSENILPIVDVSGSMWQPVADSPSVQVIDVAISLGLYLSERTEGIFKDTIMTFSQRPQMVQLTGTDLYTRYNQLERVDWGMNTNLERVFNTLLTAAKQHNVPAENMPTTLLICSDMQFDRCIATPSDSAMKMIEQKYRDKGYEVPKIVFWTLNAKAGNVPVTAHKSGAALVSGFSPAIMQSILSGNIEEFTPKGVMLEAIMNDRYKY